MAIKLKCFRILFKKTSMIHAALLLSAGVMTSSAGAVNITYDFSGNCINDCGPLGVLDATVDLISGTLELDRSEPVVSQTWTAADVLAYSFTFDSFTIDHTNSTLSDSQVGNFPYTTTAFSPFSLNDGFILARYDVDNSIFLNIGINAVNLVQGDLTSCTGSCQTIARGTWLRTSEIPVPAAIWLFGSGVLGVVAMSRRKAS